MEHDFCFRSMPNSALMISLKQHNNLGDRFYHIFQELKLEQKSLNQNSTCSV